MRHPNSRRTNLSYWNWMKMNWRNCSTSYSMNLNYWRTRKPSKS